MVRMIVLEPSKKFVNGRASSMSLSWKCVDVRRTIESIWKKRLVDTSNPSRTYYNISLGTITQDFFNILRFCKIFVLEFSKTIFFIYFVIRLSLIENHLQKAATTCSSPATDDDDHFEVRLLILLSSKFYIKVQKKSKTKIWTIFLSNKNKLLIRIKVTCRTERMNERTSYLDYERCDVGWIEKQENIPLQIVLLLSGTFTKKKTKDIFTNLETVSFSEK